MSKPWFTFNKGFVYDVIRRKEIDNMHIILKGFILINKNRKKEKYINLVVYLFYKYTSF